MRVLKEVRQHLKNYHLKSGVFHFYRGEHGPAAEFLTRTLTEDSDLSAADRRAAIYYLVHTRIGAAVEFEAKGEIDRAIEQYRLALDVMPGYPDVELKLADAYAQQGQADAAIEHYRAALESNPVYVDARLRLAYMLLSEGRLEESRREFRTAHADRIQIQENRVLAAEEALVKGQTGEARELYQDVFREDYGQFRSHLEAGLALLRTEKWDDAVRELSEAARVCPRFADVQNYLGVALAEGTEREAACDAFRRSVEINPGYLVAWLNLAYVCFSLDDVEQARLCLQEVLEREPDNSPALHLAEQLSAAPRNRPRHVIAQGEP
ncbi:MAG: tetratricopeptide repeat protein [Acidobacteriota bacterium]